MGDCHVKAVMAIFMCLIDWAKRCPGSCYTISGCVCESVVWKRLAFESVN